MARKCWFKIKNEKGEAPEISIYDEIGFWGVTAREFIDEVKALNADSLTVRINSPGGSVFDGIAIHNFLKNRKNVTVYVDGLAASIASVIAMAGDEIVMAENSMMMIHNPIGFADGEADDFREKAELLDKIKDSLVTTYESRTGKSRDEISAWMDAETWFTAAEAIKEGFATSVGEQMKMAAVSNFNLSRFGRVPESLRNQSKENPPTRTNQHETQMKQLMKSLADAGLIASADISEDQAVADLQTNLKKRDAEAEARTKKIYDLTSKLGEAEASEADALAQAAETAIDSYIKEGRIKEGVKDKWVASYLTDKEAAIALIESIDAPKKQTVPGAAPLNQGNSTGSEEDDEVATLRAQLKNETDPAEKGRIARELRKARGVENLFAVN